MISLRAYLAERLPASVAGYIAPAAPAAADLNATPAPSLRQRIISDENYEFYAEEVRDTYQSARESVRESVQTIRESVQAGVDHPFQTAWRGVRNTTSAVFRNTVSTILAPMPMDPADLELYAQEMDADGHLVNAADAPEVSPFEVPPRPPLGEVARDIATNLFINRPAIVAPDGSVLQPAVPSTLTVVRENARAIYPSRVVRRVVQSEIAQTIAQSAQNVVNSPEVQEFIQSEAVQEVVQSTPVQTVLHPVRAVQDFASTTAYNALLREPPELLSALTSAVQKLTADPAKQENRDEFLQIMRRFPDEARRKRAIKEDLKKCREDNCTNDIEVARILALLEGLFGVIQANGAPNEQELNELFQKLNHNLANNRGLLGVGLHRLISYGIDLLSGGQGYEFIMSSPMLGILKDILNHPNGLTDPTLKEQLAIVIGQIERKEWTALRASLPALLTCINNARIYVNGLAVPFLGASAPVIEPSAPINQFALNVNHNRTDTIPDQPRNLDDIKGEISKLVSYASKYGCIQWVCGSVCGMAPPSDDFYLQMIRDSKTAQDPAAELRRLVFAQIDQADVWFFTRWFAKLAYMIATPMLSYVISQFAEKLTHDMEAFLTRGQANEFAGLQNHLIDKLTDYLTTLSGAYKRVAHNADPDARMSVMIPGELEKPQFNGGFATADLYNEVVTKALTDYRLTIDLSKSINDYVDSFAFDPASPLAFMTPIAQFTLYIFAAIANVLLFFPEWGINLLLNYGAKRVITENELMDKLVQSSLSTLEAPGGYTHSFNLILRDLLQSVWETVSTPEFDAEPLQESQAMSDARQQQMRILIKTLFEVLAQKKFDTPGDLEKALRNPSFFDQIQQSFDTQVSEGVIQATIDILLYVFEQKLTTGELQKQTFNILATINRTFEEESRPASRDEMLATQQAIADLLDNILNKSIDKAIKAKFDLDKEYQERELARVVEEMAAMKISKKGDPVKFFVPEQKAKIQAIRDGAPEDGSSLMEVVLAGNREFQSMQITAVNRNVSRNTYLDATLKAELSREYEKLAHELSEDQPYQRNLDQAIVVQRDITHDYIQWVSAKRAQDHLGFATDILEAHIGPNGSGDEDVLYRHSQYEAEIDSVQTTMREAGVADAVNFDELKDRSRNLFRTQRQIDLQLVKLDVDSTLFLNFYQRKQRALGDPVGFFRLFTYLFNPKNALLAAIEQIDGLPGDQKERLIQAITDIDNSSNLTELHAKHADYQQVFGEMLANRRATLQAQKEQVDVGINQIRRDIEAYIGAKNSSIEANVTARDTLLAQAQTELDRIYANIQAFRPSPINRLYALEGINKWVVRLLKDYVVRNTKDKVVGLVDLARTPYNWRFASHRLIMLPYIRAEQIN